MSIGPINPQGSLTSNPGILQALYPGIDLTAFSQLQTEQQAALEVPVQALSQQIANLQKTASTWQAIQGDVQALQADAQALATASTWSSAQAATSDTTVVNATAGSSALPGSYTVTVTTQGSYDQWLGQGQSSDTTALGLQGSFTLNGATINISTSQSLQDIAQAINAADAGAQAQVLSSTSGGTTTYYLSLDSTQYQELAITDPNGIFAGTGSSGLGMTETQKGGSWAYTVNGVATTSTSGQDSTTVPGLTLTLAGVGTATVSVSTNTSAAQQALSQFTSDYNALQSAISGATGKGDILQGDPTAEGIMTQVNQILLSDNTGAPASYQSAADGGLTLNLQPDNSTLLKFNAQTFATASQSNPQALQSIFQGSSGIMTQLSTVLQNLGTTGSTGIIQGVLANITNQTSDLNAQETQEQNLINLQVTAMQNQFNQEMQALLAVTAQQTSISQLFSALQNGGSSSASSSSSQGG